MSPHIIDIRPPSCAGATDSLPSREDLLSSLSNPTGQKSLPTVLLYDSKGLRLYDDITTKAADFYYLFGCEEEILTKYSGDIVRVMLGAGEGETQTSKHDIVELGAGSLRKTSHLLSALSKSNTNSTYYALDLSPSELHRTLSSLPMTEGVQIKGICGTYESGIEFIRNGGLHGHTPSLSNGIISKEGITINGNTDEDELTPEHSLERQSTNVKPKDSSPPTPPPTPPLNQSHQTPLHILFLGSSLGNFGRKDASSFLRSLPLGPGDTLLLGLDMRNPAPLINEAYNDPLGITEKFIMNGLDVASSIFGEGTKGLEKGRWEYVSGYDEREGKHEAWYKSKEAQTIEIPSSGVQEANKAHTSTIKIPIAKDELIHIESSYKYADPTDTEALFTHSNLRIIYKWTDPSKGLYNLYLLERPPVSFPLLSSLSLSPSSSKENTGNNTSTTTTIAEITKPTGLPTLYEWNQLWKIWDLITLGMIPPSMMFVKPIDLRHICLFYLGHIPTFLDIHLTRVLKEGHTEPVFFKDIFERGIDPHVDDPTQCHPHSEVPTSPSDWPALPTILSFRDRVRERLSSLYESDGINSKKEVIQKTGGGRKVERVLWMTYEHEGFHAETLLYMLLQKTGEQDGTLQPPLYTPPPWDLLTTQWESTHRSYPPVTLGPTTITVGHDDFESLDLTEKVGKEGYEFGWDNEHPARSVKVGKFRIERACVTNGEYHSWWSALSELERAKIPGVSEIPASWVWIDGVIFVKTFYGPVPLRTAQHWPLIASYDEISTYAIVKGGRLPTDAELRLFMDEYESEFNGANIGWRNWHCVPAVVGGEGEKGHNGGVWEWTSTVLAKHDGFVPSIIYPGYSTDFWDGKHHVVFGGSYCTIPRLAERRSVVNFYQHNYRYAFVGGRIVYDA